MLHPQHLPQGSNGVCRETSVTPHPASPSNLGHSSVAPQPIAAHPQERLSLAVRVRHGGTESRAQARRRGPWEALWRRTQEMVSHIAQQVGAPASRSAYGWRWGSPTPQLGRHSCGLAWQPPQLGGRFFCEPSGELLGYMAARRSYSHCAIISGAREITILPARRG